MSARAFMSIYMGSPQLDQLNDDMRATELFKDAPRLVVREKQFRALCGDFMNEGGAVYELVDNRQPHPASSVETTLVERSLGTFRLETGGLAYFTLLPLLVDVPLAGAPRLET